MAEITMFYVTFPDEKTAKNIGQTLLDLKLIACINILPIQSMYLWNHQIEDGSEVIGLIKTLPEKVSACFLKIKELHPYQIPCILQQNWMANDEYSEWMIKETKW